MSEDDEVILPKNASLLKLPSTQPATQVTKNTSQPTKSHSQPSKTNLLHSPSKNIAKASPTSAGPNPHSKKMDYVQPNTRSSQPTQKPINKPSSQSTKTCSSQPTQKPKSQPKFQQKSFSQPAKPCTDPLKPVVKPRSGHQPPKKSHAQNKNKDPLQFIRSGRPVKPPPIQDDSDSHDSYESTEDSLYKFTKVLGDLSDTDSGNDDFNSRGPRKIGCDSWHSEDMDKVLDFDEKEATVYPPYNEKAKFENLKLEAKVRGRPPKLHVSKGKEKRAISPQPATTTAIIPISAGIIKGSSAVTTKKLASLMTFVPTPGFKRPRKKDNTI
ncbi:uncharacterized protein LOC130958170 [Arachis stenosperma]|uniref:uncharacterized protein LOC130958170 n=1 Tax=Arachis stenosperma TaxID=217475 RepID=UPI0025AD9916|nr:uncharacterized protein LOC130958170 [Arachis stenosperma]